MNISTLLDDSKAIQIHQLLRQLTVFVLSILLVKMGLSQQAIGVYETFMFIASSLSFYWVSGLSNASFSIFPTLDERQKPVFLFNMFLVFNGLSIIIILLFFLFQSQLIPFFSGEDELPSFAYFLVFLLFYFPSQLIEFIYILKKENKRLIYFSILSNSLNIALIFLVLFEKAAIHELIFALLFYSILRFFWLLYEIIRLSIFRFDVSLCKSWLHLATPMIFYSFLSYFAFAFDNWLVNFMYGSEKGVFAIFRLGARELPLFPILLSGIVATFTQEAALDFHSTAAKIKAESRKLMHLLYPICILLILISPYLFEKVYSKDFRQSAEIFNIYLLLIINRVWINQPLLLGKKESKIIFYISIIELIANVFLSIIGAHYWGLEGIAYGTLIAFTLEKILQSLYLKYKYQLPLKDYLDLKYYSFYTILLFLAYIIAEMT